MTTNDRINKIEAAATIEAVQELLITIESELMRITHNVGAVNCSLKDAADMLVKGGSC